jgi:cell pole-organizing protein PopZ
MSGTAPPPAGGQDQSMDDILASIRRILNEDEAGAQPTEAAGPGATSPEAPAMAAAPPEPPPAPVLTVPERAPTPPPRAAAEPIELTSDMLVSPPAQAAPQLARAEIREAPPAPSMGMDDTSGLIAPAAAAAAAASVGSLLRAVSSERGSQVYRGGPSIEDLVREEIRPILKDWLDQHLPPLVERLVRAEIERVVNRALP